MIHTYIMSMILNRGYQRWVSGIFARRKERYTWGLSAGLGSLKYINGCKHEQFRIMSPDVRFIVND